MAHSGRNGKSDESGQHLDVVIETPKGSRNKFKYEAGSRRFRLSKILPHGMIFPYDFGFVPETRGEDGDPIDVLVLIEEPTFPGCVLECRLIGVIEARQQEKGGKPKRNDRLIAVASQSIIFADVNQFHDLNPFILKNIEGFFVNYQALRNVQVTVVGRQGPRRALQLVKDAGV